MSRVAVLLCVHDRVELVNRFVDQLLEEPGCGVWVHVDAKSEGMVEPLRAHERVKVLESRIRVDWGDFSQVEATLALMRAALADVEVEHLLLRSGQDLAVRQDWVGCLPPAGESMMSFTEVPWGSGFANWVRCRWPRCCRRRYAWKGHPCRVLRGGLLKLARRGWRVFPNRERLPEGWRLYHGSNWVTLSRRHAEAVLEQVERLPALVGFFRETLCPDERFFQTALLNSGFGDEVHNADLHYEIRRGNNHPKTLTMEDLPGIAASGKAFARKFDLAVDRKVFWE